MVPLVILMIFTHATTLWNIPISSPCSDYMLKPVKTFEVCETCVSVSTTKANKKLDIRYQTWGSSCFCDQYPDIVESFLMLQGLRIANTLCRFPGKSLTLLWLTRVKQDGMEDGIQFRVTADFQQMKLPDGTFVLLFLSKQEPQCWML